MHALIFKGNPIIRKERESLTVAVFFFFFDFTLLQLSSYRLYNDKIYYYPQVLSSMGSWYVFYFVFVVFFGSFYLINLVLAVVAVSYQQEVVAMQERVSCLLVWSSSRHVFSVLPLSQTTQASQFRASRSHSSEFVEDASNDDHFRMHS